MFLCVDRSLLQLDFNRFRSCDNEHFVVCIRIHGFSRVLINCNYETWRIKPNGSKELIQTLN
jgi:hypothetical protein